jgi:ubiquinone/menaquinone biosynthesis C-methylase UbiE
LFSVDHLNQIRLFEIEALVRLFPAGARILEFGAGVGVQSLELSRKGFDVAAIDLPDSQYASYMVFAVKPYDGRTIPFSDGSFDIVFSSNVLEHIQDLDGAYREFTRVLKPNGFCVHVMPTHTWKLWSAFTSWIDVPLWALSFGARGSTLSEFWTFRPEWWRRQFRKSGYVVVEDWPMGLFYTGNMLVGTRTGVALRRTLSHLLGSSTHVFKVAPLKQ